MSPRQYTQSARADGVAERELAVLEAAFEHFFSRYYEDVTLKDIAETAGTTEQTVLRYFGSKEGVLEATTARLGHRLGGARMDDPGPGDWRKAVEVTVDAYEEHGRRTLLLLAQEDRVSAIKGGTDLGRANHLKACAGVFAPWLPDADDPGFDAAIAPYVVALDVYTWKLLRLDAGLSRNDTIATIGQMVEALLVTSDISVVVAATASRK